MSYAQFVYISIVLNMPASTINLTYEYLADDLKQVKAMIEKYCQSSLPEASAVLDMVKARNGKMVRPMLVLLSGKAYGQLTNDHYIIAAVLEMIHVASLLHDDVLDEAETRRFQPSLNNLIGNRAAVLAGDLLLSISLNAALDLENQGEFKDVIKIISQLCEGELAQQRTSGCGSLTENQYLDIVTFKTASLLACCIERGAFLAGADADERKAAFKMGQDFGIAFQIMDDIKDIISEEDESGKTAGTDFLLGKLTLPVIDHVVKAGPDSVKWLEGISSEEFNSETRRKLIERLNQTGSIEYCKDKVEYLSKDIYSFISSIEDKKLQQVYKALIDKVICL